MLFLFPVLWTTGSGQRFTLETCSTLHFLLSTRKTLIIEIRWCPDSNRLAPLTASNRLPWLPSPTIFHPISGNLTQALQPTNA